MNRIKEQLSNFARAFGTHTAGMYETCNCGKTFFDNWNHYDWDENQKEKFLESKTAVARDYAIECFQFENSLFVPDCDCWHSRVEKYIDFFDVFKVEIGEYYRLEKADLEREANRTPVINE